MKEADEGLGQQGAANSSSQDPGNGKIDKDMKGLVYQGGVPLDSTPTPSDPYSTDPGSASESKEEKEPKEEKETKEETGYKGIASPDGEKGDNILNFSENEGGKGKLIALVVVAIIIIVGVAYLVTHTHASGPKIVVTTTTISANSPTTTVLHNNAKIIIYNIDLLYNYSGPASINKTSCQKATQSVVQTYSNHLNGSAKFLLYDSQSSGYCPLTVTKIYTTTPGFKIVSISPTVPYSIPSHSDIYYIMTLTAPSVNYTGPLSITINEN